MKKKAFRYVGFAILAATVLTSGCATNHPKEDYAAAGALSGAILGAVVGNNVGDGENQVLGAALGAIIGSSVGKSAGEQKAREEARIRALEEQINTQTVFVRNSNGSETPVKLYRISDGIWEGPRGEIYRGGFPSEEQLRQAYGF